MSAITRAGQSSSTRGPACTTGPESTAPGLASTPSSAVPRKPRRDNDMSPEASSRALLTVLSAEHAEWRPLLALIEEALQEIERPAWAHSVPALERSGPGPEPLLSRAVIKVAPRSIERWIRRVMAIAAAGAREEPFIAAVTAGRLDTLALFEAAVSQDVDRLDDLAQGVRDTRGVLRILAPIIAMPMLHACRRAWADRMPTGWAYRGWPVCGGWPALAENQRIDGQPHPPSGGMWRECLNPWRVLIVLR